MGCSLIITETAPTSVSNLNGNDPATNEFKTQEPQQNKQINNKREKINMQTRTHENFSQVKETKEIFEGSQVENNPKSFVFKLL
ncbi:hypothetical protein KVC37_01685 [Helicobacter pylori]|nr:hypothetical protein KVC37_01685 [Helicobacter pylori]